ncbi:MAG TPA: acyl carrier protein [Bryobacteraceae bacterium]|jgi:acyl carrier protein|nr:acyl carrier protein [Bryobacteraceae bacterium]
MPADAGTDQLGHKVIEVIARTQRIPVESVTPDSTFDQLKIDSLDGINIVFELEKEFNIDIPDEGVARLKTVRETIDGVRQLVEKKSETAASGAV